MPKWLYNPSYTFPTIPTPEPGEKEEEEQQQTTINSTTLGHYQTSHGESLIQTYYETRESISQTKILRKESFKDLGTVIWLQE